MSDYRVTTTLRHIADELDERPGFGDDVDSLRAIANRIGATTLDATLTAPGKDERARLALDFVRAVIDTDGNTGAEGESNHLFAIDVAGVVHACIQGDRYFVSADDSLWLWAKANMSPRFLETVFTLDGAS